MKDKLDILNEVQRVEAPAFLFTRILQRIDNVKAARFSPQFVWPLGISFALLLALNVFVVTQQAPKQASSSIAREMKLVPDNSLYK